MNLYQSIKHLKIIIDTRYFIHGTIFYLSNNILFHPLQIKIEKFFEIICYSTHINNTPTEMSSLNMINESREFLIIYLIYITKKLEGSPFNAFIDTENNVIRVPFTSKYGVKGYHIEFIPNKNNDESEIYIKKYDKDFDNYIRLSQITMKRLMCIIKRNGFNTLAERIHKLRDLIDLAFEADMCLAFHQLHYILSNDIEKDTKKERSKKACENYIKN
jgi:hypothetical protein